jgi:hypothetical protein
VGVEGAGEAEGAEYSITLRRRGRGVQHHAERQRARSTASR